MVQQGVKEKWNIGKGSEVSRGKDCLFMMVTVLNHGEPWDFLVQIFNLKGPNFECIIM